MKKNALLPLLGCAVMLCAACNDEDMNDARDMNGAYAGEALELTYSGAAFPGKTVEFDTEDGITASLKLLGVVPGEKETLLTGIVLSETAPIYHFTKETGNDHRSLSVTGAVTNDKLTVDVVAEYSNELLGAWDWPKSGQVKFNWTMLKEDTDGDGVPDKRPIVNLVTVYKADGSKWMDLSPGLLGFALPSILKKQVVENMRQPEFLKDGNMAGEYKVIENDSTESWKPWDLNTVHYDVQGTFCNVYPNAVAFSALMSKSESLISNTELLEKLLENGLPFNYELTPASEKAGETLYMYLDENYFKEFSPYIGILALAVPEDYKVELPIGKETGHLYLKELLTNLPGALNKTENLEVGFKFVRVEE